MDLHNRSVITQESIEPIILKKSCNRRDMYARELRIIRGTDEIHLRIRRMRNEKLSRTLKIHTRIDKQLECPFRSVR